MSTSVLNPGLLINIAFLAPAKETNPRRQQPTGNKAAQADKGRLPNQKDGHSIGNGATNNSVGGGEKEKMNRADEQKPGEAAEVLSDKIAMRSKGGGQCVVMKGARD